MIKILNQALVDGETWYTVVCGVEEANYIRNSQSKKQELPIVTSGEGKYFFDVPESLCTVLKLIEEPK
jgi:hypothetical protein